MGAPTPVYELLCPCGRDSSISQILFLQVCCTRDLCASEHHSGSFSGYCILNSCFSAIGDVAKQLCSACCRGQMLIFCVSCLSAINKGKKTPPNSGQHWLCGTFANMGGNYSHDSCSPFQKQRERGGGKPCELCRSS